MAKTGNVIKHDFGGRNAVPKKGEDVIGNLKALTAKAQGLTEKDKKNKKRFDKQFKKLAKQTGADAKDFRADQTQRAAYRSMIELLLTIIPVAQEKYLENKSESTFYALRGAMDQMAQLMGAIRTLDSLEEQAQHIVVRIIMPAMVTVVQNMISGLQIMKAETKGLDLKPAQQKKLDDLLTKLGKDHASVIKETQKAIEANVQKYLVGDD